MQRNVALGIQSFPKLRENNYFYIDKTHFIKEWWERGDDITLITRPRRFGKTLMLDMVKTFFHLNITVGLAYLKDYIFGMKTNIKIYKEQYLLFFYRLQI